MTTLPQNRESAGQPSPNQNAADADGPRADVHDLLNNLAPVVSLTELMLSDPSCPDHFKEWLETSRNCLQQAAAAATRLQRKIRKAGS